MAALLGTHLPLLNGALDAPSFVNTPSPLAYGVPANITWTGGTSPYSLYVATLDLRQILRRFDGINTTHFMWTPNVPAGTFVALQLVDSLNIPALDPKFTIIEDPGASTHSNTPHGSSTRSLSRHQSSTPSTSQVPSSSHASSISRGTIPVSTPTHRRSSSQTPHKSFTRTTSPTIGRGTSISHKSSKSSSTHVRTDTHFPSSHSALSTSSTHPRTPSNSGQFKTPTPSCMPPLTPPSTTSNPNQSEPSSTFITPSVSPSTTSVSFATSTSTTTTSISTASQTSQLRPSPSPSTPSSTHPTSGSAYTNATSNGADNAQPSSPSPPSYSEAAPAKAHTSGKSVALIVVGVAAFALLVGLVWWVYCGGRSWRRRRQNEHRHGASLRHSRNSSAPVDGETPAQHASLQPQSDMRQLRRDFVGAPSRRTPTLPPPTGAGTHRLSITEQSVDRPDTPPSHLNPFENPENILYVPEHTAADLFTSHSRVDDETFSRSDSHPRLSVPSVVSRLRMSDIVPRNSLRGAPRERASTASLRSYLTRTSCSDTASESSHPSSSCCSDSDSASASDRSDSSSTTHIPRSFYRLFPAPPAYVPRRPPPSPESTFRFRMLQRDEDRDGSSELEASDTPD